MDFQGKRKLKDIRARLAELKRLEQEHQEKQSQIVMSLKISPNFCTFVKWYLKKLWEATKRNSAIPELDTLGSFISPSRSKRSIESNDNSSFDVVDQLQSSTVEDPSSTLNKEDNLFESDDVEISYDKTIDEANSLISWGDNFLHSSVRSACSSES